MEPSKIGENQDTFQCLKCEYTACSASALRNHVTRTHINCTSRPFGCNFAGCDYRATKKDILSQHFRNCHENKKELRKVHACNQCDFRANCKSRLDLHAAGHSDERPFGCDFPS